MYTNQAVQAFSQKLLIHIFKQHHIEAENSRESTSDHESYNAQPNNYETNANKGREADEQDYVVIVIETGFVFRESMLDEFL